jgi:arabinan endo-1,5-alpha-L-arabinosidase
MKVSMFAFAFFIFVSIRAQDTVNPLKGDIRVHDPVMIKEGDTYYVFHTGRGISIKTSKDKINWRRAGSVFSFSNLPAWHKNDIPSQDGHLWAPDIYYMNGKYYLYYSVSAWMNFNSSIGLATNTTLDSTNSNYNWIDEGQVISYKNGGEGVNVIDPQVLKDKDGKFWMFYDHTKLV